MVPLKTVPGSINYYRPGTRDRIEPIQTHGQVQIGVDLLSDRIFYVDMLLTPTNPASAGKGVTATFTLHQRDQQFQLMSPMLARQQSEFLGPLVDRTFNILWRQSMARRFQAGSPLMPPPAALAGAKLRVKYVSPIATAQKTSQLDSVVRLVQMATMLMSVDPTAARVLDGQAIVRLGAEGVHASPLARRSAPRRSSSSPAAAITAASALMAVRPDMAP